MGAMLSVPVGIEHRGHGPLLQGNMRKADFLRRR